MFQYTTAIRKIRAMNARKKVIQGGTSAGKTFGILPVLIDAAARYPGKEISVVSESVPHLRRGVLKDFRKIMELTGRWQEARYKETLLTYRFANGSYIEFFSADQEAKLRGARRHILYLNEANTISFEAYHQLAIRTSEDIYLDFNPTAEFWAHTEVLTEDDSAHLILNYLDNEALPPTIVRDIEAAREKGKTSAFWANWWKVYGLGQVGSLQGVVFDNWQLIDTVPEGAALLGCGLDFGYTHDPTTLIALYRHDERIIFDELVYRKGLLNSDIAGLMRASPAADTLVYADSAEPKSIAEIASYGLHITGTAKGKDSVSFGIGILQQQPFCVTRRSLHLIRELRAYTWEVDKAGVSLNVPIDAFNHCIDAMRYVAMNRLARGGGDWGVEGVYV